MGGGIARHARAMGMITALSGAAARALESLPEASAAALNIPCELARPVLLGVLGEAEGARRVRRGPRSVIEILATHPWIPRREAAGADGLAAAAGELLDLGCEVLVVAGGDAAVHAALTAALRRRRSGLPAPVMALACGGRQAAGVARHIGAIEDMDGLERVLVEARAGRVSGEPVAVPTFEVRVEAEREPVYGTALEAASGIGRALALAGPGAPWAALAAAMRARLSGAARPVPVRVQAEGLALETDALAVAATSRPGRGEQGAGAPRSAEVRVGVLARARAPATGLPPSGRAALALCGLRLWRAGGRRLELEVGGPVAVDGVGYGGSRSAPARIAAGPAAIFLRPAAAR